MVKQKQKTKAVIVPPKKEDFLDKLDAFFKKHEKRLLWVSLSLGAVMSLLLFDCKVSLSGDDCDYIINAQAFIKHFTYPGGRGALYPVVLSPFLIGGLNLILLKSLSAVFIILSMWLMYKSFQGKIPASILMPTLLIVNICPHIFFFASHTYSEPFFMLTQSLFIYLFSKYFWGDAKSATLQLLTDWKKLLFIGLCFLSMGLTRTIGFAVIGAVIVYFCFGKQWKNLCYTLVAFGCIFILFSVIKKIVWPESGASYDINNYLAKNFYAIEQGMEDLPGFLKRLVVNSNIYLSNFLYQFMGLSPITNVVKPDKSFLTLCTYILFFICFATVYKKNNPLLFTGVYVGVMNFASFVLLQTNWAQDRLIMIYYPLMLLFILGGIYYLLKNGVLKIIAVVYPMLLIGLTIGTCLHSQTSIALNVPILQQNLSGNDLYGLTPDWENFIKMSRWVNERFDKDAVIASRKPSISYVYTGREFQGIYNVPAEKLQDVVSKTQEDQAGHVFLIAEWNRVTDTELAPYTEYIFVNKQNAEFLLNGKKCSNAILYKIPKEEYDDSMSLTLTANNINNSIDHNAFLAQYVRDRQGSFDIFSPERLMKVINDNHIKYLILARIRIYTAENTGYYVNTFHQYIKFIQFKYPNSFRIIHTIGKEEICELAEYIGE